MSPRRATARLTSVKCLRAMVAARAPLDGRTDSLYAGLRYYRFSAPIEYQKTQLLMPGVVVVLQGGKSVKLAGRTLAYDEMNYLVLGGETVCHGTVVKASSTHPYLAIHLDLPPEVLVKTFIALAQTRTARRAAKVKESFVTPVDTRVLEALTRLLPATDAAVDRDTIAPLAVEEIVVRLMRSDAAAAIRDAAAVTRSAIRIQRSIRFIQTEFRRPLSVSELAKQVAMSPSHYAHRFRQVAGVSPMRYLRDVRLDQARALLLGGGRRSSEAAASVGFESTAHFTREFKHRFEASPTEYLRRMSGQGRGDISSDSQ